MMWTTVFRPPGNGPFPLAVINHGSTQNELRRAGYAAPQYTALTEWLVAHGYAVAVPQRPGHGKTGGTYYEDQGGCANADFRKYVLTKSAQMPAQPQLKQKGFQFQNENKLIFNYPGAMGGKTGFTTVARHSYVGAASRNGRRLVVTLLGAEAHPQRGWQQGAALLDWGFSLPKDASVGKLITPEEVAQRSATTNARVESTTAAKSAVSSARSSGGGLPMLPVALGVAAVLAGAPLLLLLIQRRRRRPGRSGS